MGSGMLQWMSCVKMIWHLDQIVQVSASECLWINQPILCFSMQDSLYQSDAFTLVQLLRCTPALSMFPSQRRGGGETWRQHIVKLFWPCVRLIGQDGRVGNHGKHMLNINMLEATINNLLKVGNFGNPDVSFKQRNQTFAGPDLLKCKDFQLFY